MERLIKHGYEQIDKLSDSREQSALYKVQGLLTEIDPAKVGETREMIKYALQIIDEVLPVK